MGYRQNNETFEIYRELKPVLFTLPAMIPFVVFWLAPLLYVFYLSFTEWDFMSPEKTFVGLTNYLDLFSNPAFYKALRVTLLFCAGSVLPVILIGLGLALLMNGKLKGSTLYQVLLFSPWVTPTVAVSIVWSWIYEPEIGLANTVLDLLGLEKIGWLQDPKWALLGVLLVTIWKSVGWAMIFIWWHYAMSLQICWKQLNWMEQMLFKNSAVLLYR